MSTVRTHVRLLVSAVGALQLLLGCTRHATVGLVDDDAGFTVEDANIPDQPDQDGGSADGALTQQQVIDECKPGSGQGVDSASIAALLRGGTRDGSMRFLYPYDGTVFPRGVGAPALMWDGPSAEAVYVHLYNERLDYRACLRSDGSNALTLPSTGWSAAEDTAATSASRLTLELTSVADGRVSGPIAQEVVIAPGELGGSVLYMSYGATGSLVGTSSLQRLRPGQSPQRLLTPLACAGCHGVSADGSVVSGYSDGSGAVLQVNASSVTAVSLPALPVGAEFAALVPNGSLYVAPAHPPGLGPRSNTLSSQTAVLYETLTGVLVADSGVAPAAVTPAFSPDGLFLTFVDGAVASGRSVAMMRFDATKRAASEHRVLFTDERRYPGWPTFLPDRSAVVFALGERSDFSGDGAGLLRPINLVPPSDLYSVSTMAGASAATRGMLTVAMGFNTGEDAAAENTYLPFGPEDLHRSYNPSVSPRSAGGFHWVLFDAMRHYGNRGIKRQIWVAAIDASRQVGGSLGASHPAFYLPGQEFAAGNIRPVLLRDAP